MSKAKTNALDALRALIAERQQYEQWMTSLEAKREGTAEHVFERVQADYRGRLDKVLSDIRGHAEELQLSISTLSSRLVEVARDEDTRREGLQEAELRAAVGEYEPQQWERLKNEAEEALAKIAGDRASLDAQLGELRAIQKLSEAGSVGEVPAAAGGDGGASGVAGDAAPGSSSSIRAASPSGAPEASPRMPDAAATPSDRPPEPVASAAAAAPAERTTDRPGQAQERLPLESPRETPPAHSGATHPGPTSGRGRSGKTPPGGSSAVRSRSEAVRPDQAKTLKCPECGAPNLPTEWYCERCGGELATM